MSEVIIQEKKTQPAVAPHLFVSNGEEALDYYEKSFNAKIEQKSLDANKKILHSVLIMPNGGKIFLCDDYPEFGETRLLPEGRASPVTIHLYFETHDKAQEFWDSSVKKNQNDVKVIMDYKPQFWNENYGAFRDKYQHSWSVGSPISDDQLSKKETCIESNKENIFESNKENCFESNKENCFESNKENCFEQNKENCIQTTKKRKTMDENCSSECNQCDDAPSLKRQKLEPDVEQINENVQENGNGHAIDNSNGHNEPSTTNV